MPIFGACFAHLACTDFDGLHASTPTDASTEPSVDGEAPPDSEPSESGNEQPPGCSGAHLQQDPTSGHCDQFVTVRIDWSGAESDCVTWGGHLVSILSATEYSFVKTFANTELSREDAGPDPGIWIGLHRPGGGGAPDAGYVWVSGEPLGFANWSAKSPTGKPCVYQYGPQFADCWDDFECTVSANYVCKR